MSQHKCSEEYHEQCNTYKGYYRTWYGIALHLMLWSGFFVAFSQVPMKLLPKSQARYLGGPV